MNSSTLFALVEQADSIRNALEEGNVPMGQVDDLADALFALADETLKDELERSIVLAKEGNADDQ